jgi:signal transduction histidine kinase
MLNFELLIVAISSIGNLVLGLFTLIKNPKSVTNKLFLSLTLTLSLYVLFNFFAINQVSDAATLFWIRMVMAVALFIGWLFFLFIHTFPHNNLRLKPLWFVLSLIFTVALVPLTFSQLLFSGVQPGTFQPTPGPGMALFMLQTLLFTGGGTVILVKKFLHSSGVEKMQLRLFLLGAVVMFTLIFLTNVIFVVILNISDFVSLLPIYILIFVGSISYAIIKHRFLDIGLLIFRTISFSLITLIIIFLYALALFSFLQFIPQSLHTIFNIILALILVYSYNPIKHTIESLTKNIFYKQSYSSETVFEQLGEILRSTIALDTLTKNTLAILTGTMHITHGAYYLTQKDKDKYRIYETGNHLHELTSGEIESLIKAAKNNLLIFEDLEESPVKMLMRDAQISVSLPLKIKQENHGMLVFGGKASGEIYNQQDIDVLEIFMPQISVAIHNAKSVDEIRRFNVTLKEEVQAATTDLKSANRNLKHLDKLKDEFVFIATHELKNPVTAMRGYLSMLQEGMFGHIPEKMKGPIDQLQASNQQLVDLVNDLLQIARSEAKTLNITTEDVNLCPVIDTVIENVKPLADQKNITVKHLQPASKEIMVKTDPNRLKEIMNNLIGNAIKYSDSGTITINHAIDKEFVTTSVKDQGVGISQEDQKKLFTRFYRVEEEAAKGIPGTGLGLFIVKQLIEKMHGKIWLESTKGQGTTFSFTLPRAN